MKKLLAVIVATLLCLNDNLDQRRYDRCLDLYLRALTHTGGAPRRRADTTAMGEG